MAIDIKGVVALLVVVGSFVLVGAYVVQGKVPDGLVLAFVTGALMLILGFYFGHANGAQTQLANATVALAQQAMDKRAADVAAVPVVPAALAAVVPGVGG